MLQFRRNCTGQCRNDESKDKTREQNTQKEEETSNCEKSRCEVQQPLEEFHPAIALGDLSQVVKLKAQRPLSDSEKFFVLENHFVSRRSTIFLQEFLLDSNNEVS